MVGKAFASLLISLPSPRYKFTNTSYFEILSMENANLTFLTPALITGDRSECGTIAHEACHSWFGNLIGNSPDSTLPKCHSLTLSRLFEKVVRLGILSG